MSASLFLNPQITSIYCNVCSLSVYLLKLQIGEYKYYVSLLFSSLLFSSLLFSLNIYISASLFLNPQIRTRQPNVCSLSVHLSKPKPQINVHGYYVPFLFSQSIQPLFDEYQLKKRPFTCLSVRLWKPQSEDESTMPLLSQIPNETCAWLLCALKPEKEISMSAPCSQ